MAADNAIVDLFALKIDLPPLAKAPRLRSLRRTTQHAWLRCTTRECSVLRLEKFVSSYTPSATFFRSAFSGRSEPTQRAQGSPISGDWGLRSNQIRSKQSPRRDLSRKSFFLFGVPTGEDLRYFFPFEKPFDARAIGFQNIHVISFWALR